MVEASSRCPDAGVGRNCRKLVQVGGTHSQVPVVCSKIESDGVESQLADDAVCAATTECMTSEFILCAHSDGD